MQRQHSGTQGILNPAMVGRKFQLARPQPSPDLVPLIEHYWIVSWDLPDGETHTQETLPYPCAHLVFEAGATHVVGVMTGKFTRRLQGHGQVFGVKFRPAGFHTFFRRPLRLLTDRTLPFAEVFGEPCDALEAELLALGEHGDERAQVALAEDYLRTRLSEMDERVEQVERLNRIVGCVAARREITSVDDILALCEGCAGDTSKRTLQRLFSEYIGVGPKRVIRRFRLHEAAGRIDASRDAGSAIDWPRIAQELGYSDQTHFIKDFKALIGKTPAEYGRQGA